MITPWECSADIHISAQMLDAIEYLHESGELAGGVKVEPTTGEATYRYLIDAGSAEVEVTGLERGVIYVRWDGATRKSRRDSYGYPPRLKGLPD